MGFFCKNKHCLTDLKWVCDGFNDCGDNSDEEQNCGKLHIFNSKTKLKMKILANNILLYLKSNELLY